MDLSDLKDIRVREWMNDNPAYVAGGAAALMVVCLLLVVCQFTGGSAGSADVKMIYYDLPNQKIKIVEFNTSESFPGSPLEGTTEVYEAAIFACRECPQGAIKDGMSREELEAAGMFIGWLQKREEAANPAMAELDGFAYSYRHIDGEKWYSATSETTAKLFSWPYDKCKDARPCGVK